MDRAALDATAEVEDRHWWFRARRQIIDDEIRRLRLPQRPRILEAGCGSGGNLPFLARLGDVSAFELDLTQLAKARARGVARVEPGRLPEAVPFAGETFDLIVMLDVLEHLKDDRAGVGAVLPRLAPGGYFLASVPAIETLWSHHDVSHHHYRRYRRRTLRHLMEDTGLGPVKMSYFNTLLFPMVAAGRLWQRLSADDQSMGLGVPPSPVNTLLQATFASERYPLRFGSLPIGASLLVVARVGNGSEPTA